jgi:hypothetical protein
VPAREDLPTNADSDRRAYFRSLVNSRPAIYALVLGCLAAFLFGVYRRDPLLMVAAPVGVAALVLVPLALLADRRAAQSFFKSFAETHRLEYVGDWEVLPFTPVLGAGDRQWCEHWMLGDLVHDPRLSGGFGHFHYERRHERQDLEGSGRGHTVEHRRLTVCVIDLEESLPLFTGIFLRQRRGLLEFTSDWLANVPTHPVEVESAAFCERYGLRIVEEQDEMSLRQLLSPSLVDWLARHPLPLGFELRAGTLVVFVPKPLEDSGSLSMLLEGGRKIAERVVDEAQHARASRSRPGAVRTT